MRLTVNKEQLLKALNTASRAVPAKSPMPLLSFLKLDLNDRGLEIVGSSGDFTICALVPFALDEKEIIRSAIPGKVLVNSHLFTEIIRRMDGNDINLETIDDAIAKIDDGHSSFKLNCSNAEEYPDVDLSENGQTFVASCAAFLSLVEQTAFAASTKEQKPILTALNLEASGDGHLVGTATDSARLAQKTIEIEGDVHFRTNVPARIVAEVVHLFEGADNVRVSIDDRKAVFHFGSTAVATRLIQGEYPVGKSIIPNSFNYFLEVNSQELLNAMSRVSLLSFEKDGAVKLSMTEDEVEIYAKNEANGSANERIDTFSFTGDPLEVSFNPVFIMDAIKALGGDDVTLCFNAEMRPFVVKNPKDPTIINLVTPKRAY